MLSDEINTIPVDPQFEVASLLLDTWSRADADLRGHLEQAIRAYVQQHPDFQQYLKQTVAVSEQARRLQLNGTNPATLRKLEQLYIFISQQSD